MERRKNKSKRIQIIIIIMWFTGLFLMIAGPMIKVIFKLYPSQEYRLIEDTEQIIFWEYYGKIAYYDYDSDEICFCDMENFAEKRFKVSENSIDQIEISPNEKFILYREIVYGYYGNYMMDDEYCYYKILNMDTETVITIYQGYREWYNISW